MFTRRGSYRHSRVATVYVPEPFTIFPESVLKEIDAALREYLKQTAEIERDLIRELLLSQAASSVIPALQEGLRAWMTPDELKEVTLAIESVLEQESGSAANKPQWPISMQNLRGEKGPDAIRRRRSVRMLAQIRALVVAKERNSSQPQENLRSASWLSPKTGDLMEFTLQAPCASCAGVGTLTQNSSALIFVCEACSHRVELSFKNRRSEETCCDCAFCFEQKLVFTRVLQDIFNRCGEGVLTAYNTWLAELYTSDSKRVSQQTMERDYLQNQNDLDKDLRGVLAYKPTSGEDFRDCVTRYARGDEGLQRQIETSALERRVIYRQYGAPAYTDFSELLCVAIIPLLTLPIMLHRALVRDWAEGEQLGQEESDVFAKTLSTQVVASLLSPDETLMAPLHLSRAGVDLIVSGEKIPVFRAWRYGDSSHKTTVCTIQMRAEETRSIILNPSFLEQQSFGNSQRNIGDPQPPEHPHLSKAFSPLFRSNVERNAYLRVTGSAREPERIVIPNRKFHQLIERDALHEMKSRYYSSREQDWRYLWNCELDLVVYDGNGRLVGVEEVQRGQHHNEPLWIRNDALKREALRLAGIPFLESF